MTPVLGACRFETERLLAAEWRSLEKIEWAARELDEVVVSLLTQRVTRSLPPMWQGTYTVERARRWVDERDAEGTTLLVTRRADGEPIGLVILFETSSEEGDIDVRLGYLLAEDVWGQGIASELLAGLVDWCRGQEDLASITGGVARANVASARVLEKNGFEPLENEDESAAGEQIYRLRLQ